MLPLIDVAAWEGLEPPEREWALPGWIPYRQATYLTGPGSAGKSLVTQQLATCTALGLPFLGVEPRKCNAMYLSCEDDADELHRRQAAICKALGVSMSDLAGKLHLVSLAGNLDTLLCSVDDAGRVVPTPRFESIAAVARQLDIRFLGLDNVAHLSAANENYRSEVAGFVGLLNSLAIRIDGSVLFLGHPNKAGDSFSGSTAWENQVRSRLFMQVPDTSTDRDVRVLSRQKSNYAQNGEELAFRWHQWAFIRDDDLPPDQRTEVAAVALANGDNAVFLACLRQRTSEGEGRLVGPSPGPNYAPAQFEGMAQAKGLKRDRLRAAMERLFAIGVVEAYTYRNTSKGRDVTVLREVPSGDVDQRQH
ncbi:AAA family ATPase, partial [Sphingomonas turrisvirgatae]